MHESSTLMPWLAAYDWALLAFALLCLVVMAQSFLTAPLAFLKQEQAPGMPLQGDHSLLSFRVLRTHLNSVESLGPFGFTLMLALLLGTNPTWVNGLALTHVAFRLLFWVVYYSGLGKVAGGARTLCFVGGLLANLALVTLVLFGLLQ
ncbi:MAPEG family protein [Marinicella meishanensis]|uniref:MAPEG family protein n=1 Tax=Marinicella meishanensis TaxID=2873263 RepID=UPI001CBEA59D|nr:MAPEG family protein [Marinicella sp. NBU2979]